MKQIYLNWVDVTVYEDWTFDVSNTFYQDVLWVCRHKLTRAIKKNLLH